MEKIIYQVLKTELIELEFVCDYPKRTETSIWKNQNGVLAKFHNEIFEMDKHIYFDDKKSAIQQLILNHQTEIRKLDHQIKNL